MKPLITRKVHNRVRTRLFESSTINRYSLAYISFRQITNTHLVLYEKKVEGLGVTQKGYKYVSVSHSYFKRKIMTPMEDFLSVFGSVATMFLSRKYSSVGAILYITINC